METKSGWPLALKYALILAFATIAINLAFYLINPKSVEGTWTVMGIVQLLISIVTSIYILFAAAKVRRDQDLEGVMSYGKSLGFMMQTALPAALIISFYTFIFFAYINPELLVKIWENQAEQMANSGKSDEEIEQAMKMAQIFNSPAAMTFFGAIGTMFQLFIYALIASIFTKKEPVTFE
ncbi:MAG: DUF4199 domain-containing protein [Bacteroidia bacterium]